MVDVPLADPPAGVDPTDWLDACNELRAMCGWHIAPVITETLTLDGPGGRVLILPTLRLTNLVSVTNDGTALVDPQWSANGIVYECWWSCKPRSIVAEIEHGLDKCPRSLLTIVQQMVDKPLGTDRVASRQRGPFSESYFDDGSKEAATIARYRLPRLP